MAACRRVGALQYFAEPKWRHATPRGFEVFCKSDFAARPSALKGRNSYSPGRKPRVRGQKKIEPCKML
jgi:hypothetical protein